MSRLLCHLVFVGVHNASILARPVSPAREKGVYLLSKSGEGRARALVLMHRCLNPSPVVALNCRCRCGAVLCGCDANPAASGASPERPAGRGCQEREQVDRLRPGASISYQQGGRLHHLGAPVGQRVAASLAQQILPVRDFDSLLACCPPPLALLARSTRCYFLFLFSREGNLVLW